MKYWVNVGERRFEVEVRLGDGGRTVVTVDGREMVLVMEQGGPGTHTLLVDGQPHDLAAVRGERGYSMVLRGVPLDVDVENERQHRLSSAKAARPGMEGRATLRAPMPGLVIQVDVGEGEEVERGHRLVVLEAMKMQNDIRAPRSGRVEKVLASEGHTVEQGQPLIVLE